MSFPSLAEMLRVDSLTLLAFIAMGAASFAVRAGGILMVRFLKPTPFLDAFLHHLPGAMFAALVLPALLKGGPAEWAGAGAAYLGARLTGQLAVALGLAVAVTVGLKLLGA